MCSFSGFADFVGFDDSNRDEMRQTLIKQAKYAYPSLSWQSESPLWLGFRPMSPDGVPFTGRDHKIQNLFVSCGHGSNGWTTSAGTGKLLAKIVNDEKLTDEEKKIADLLKTDRYNFTLK